MTTDALMEGAFDFILKPASNDSIANREELRNALEEKIAAFRESSDRRRRKTRRSAAHRCVSSDDVLETTPATGAACQAVIIGTSTGGPEALKVVLSRLPAMLPVPTRPDSETDNAWNEEIPCSDSLPANSNRSISPNIRTWTKRVRTEKMSPAPRQG